MFDFSRYKAGDSGFTKAISQPPALPEAEETAIQSQKILTMQAWEETRKATAKVKLMHCNLTPMEEEGRKQILKGIRES